MATLADVAVLARVSKATASRVFSHSEAVSAATAKRVQDAAQKLGFVPNVAARQLARGRIGIIALIVPTLDNRYFTPVISGAQQLVQEQGLQLTVAVHRFETPAQVQTVARLGQQVDGFILAGPQGGDELIRAAAEIKPTVLVDREVSGLDALIADTPAAFSSVAQYLLQCGHRRLAYLGGPEGSWMDSLRQRSVQEAAVSLGAQVEVYGPYSSTFSAGIAVADDLRGSSATAVIPYATALGLGLQHRLLTQGVEPMPVVTSERAIARALGREELATIDVDGVMLGRKAAELLLRRIEKGSEEPETVRIPVETGP
ncbi:LacI family DNA-binding transcriptional regulator [Nesterenkonia populi]